MRLFLAMLFILIPSAAVAGPDDDARAVVAVELAKLALKKQVPPVTSDVPTDLDQLAPPGWKKVKIGDGPWHFEKIETAPGVAAPSPFAPGNPTLGTVAPRVVVPSSLSTPSTGMGRTTTSVLSTGRFGATDCTTGT